MYRKFVPVSQSIGPRKSFGNAMANAIRDYPELADPVDRRSDWVDSSDIYAMPPGLSIKASKLDQLQAAAKKGAGKLFSATKSCGSAICRGFSKAKMEIAGRHERSVLDEFEKKGLRHPDLLFQAFQRLYFLYMAGYKHELAAAAHTAGQRLTDSEKSSVPLDVVKLFANSVCNECAKYGDVEKGKFYRSMEEFLTKSRRVKDRYDRDSIVHDIYYAVLATAQNYGTQWEDLVQAFRDGASQVIGAAVNVRDAKTDPRKRAAKAIYLFAAQIRVCSNEAEVKKQKALKQAEDMLRKEKERQLKFMSGPNGPSVINEEILAQERGDKPT